MWGGCWHSDVKTRLSHPLVMLSHCCCAFGRKIKCVLSKYWSGAESCQRGGSRKTKLCSLTHADASRPGPHCVPAASLSKSPSLTTPCQRFRVSSRCPTGINPSCSVSSRADHCCRLSVVSRGSGVFKINLSCFVVLSAKTALQPRTMEPLFILVEGQQLIVLWGLKVLLCKHFLLFDLEFQGFGGVASGLRWPWRSK